MQKVEFEPFIRFEEKPRSGFSWSLEKKADGGQDTCLSSWSARGEPTRPLDPEQYEIQVAPATGSSGRAHMLYDWKRIERPGLR